MDERNTRKEPTELKSPGGDSELTGDNPYSFTSLAWQGALIVKMLRGKLTNRDLTAKPRANIKPSADRGKGRWR
jgi:hypothetical protein